ncbi:MAG TPA: adenylate/guanylate cyclase domain-containing protein [Vicinamibacterales bacterium]
MTVLFCDLVDSTALSTRIDAEQWHAVLRTYQEVASRIVNDAEGHVAQFLGDGLLVYLGYPKAHDDDAERAVRAALAIVAAVKQANDQIERDHGVRLSVRVGIHSGPVVVNEVGTGERREILALGQTTNLAARVQSLASADSVVVSDATLRLVQGLFVTEDLGAQAIKGFTDPVRLYCVQRPSGVHSSLDFSGTRALTPLIGREQEVDLLMDRWQQVAEGTGQVILISGEGGIGKSRLARELRTKVAETPHTWLECRCSSYTQNSPLYPVIELQAQALRFAAEETNEDKLEKLRSALARAGLQPAEYLPLFAALHGLSLPAGQSPLNLSQAAQRRKTLDAFVELLLEASRVQPVLLLVEDLHWVDPSTLELIGEVVAQAPTARVLAVFTFRPTFTPPWSARSHVTSILVTRLARARVAQLIERVAGEAQIPRATIDEIVRRSDGVPFFAEELTSAALDAAEHPGALAPSQIPASLHDSLMSRLDQLGPAKELALFCATLGRDFSYELLRAASQTDEATLRQGLEQLLQAELLHRRGEPPRATYQFRHVLIQDEAYGSLLTAVRRQYHQLIADALEKHFPDRAKGQPELLAHHYHEASNPPKAAPYWLRAGQLALTRSANVEAVNQLRKGVGLVADLPPSVERNQLELALQGTLGRALAAIKGRGADEVLEAFGRARILCRELGSGPQLFPVTFGLWLFSMARGELSATLEMVPELLAMAEQANDRALLLEAHLAAGYTSFWRAEYAAARNHLRQTLSLYDPELHGSHVFVYGQDPAASAQIFDGWALWFQGYPEQAAQSVRHAIELAERTRHPFTLTGVLWQAAVVFHELGETETCFDLANRAVTLGTEQQFASQVAAGMIMRGAAQVRRGHYDDGVRQIQHGVDAFRKSGSIVTVPHHLAILAHALLSVDRIDEGLSAIEEGLQLAVSHLDQYYEPELLRLRGELLLKAGRSGAEDSFAEALKIASRHGARALELRAATSLARLWAGRGDRARARELLTGFYLAFDEGSERRDVQAAGALLPELT